MNSAYGGRRRIQARDLMRFVVPGEPTLSPDGRLAAFSLRRMDLKNNRYYSHIHLVPTRGGRVIQLTQGEQIDASPVFSPDGRHLAFVSNREEKANVWVIPVSGGEARRLTDFEAGSLRSLAWSPDGREIAFVRRDVPKEDKEKKKRQPNYKHITRLYYREDGMGFYLGHRWHIWKAGFPGGRTTQLTRGENNDESPAWSPDSQRLAFVSNRVPDADLNLENTDVFIISRRGRGLRRVTKHQGWALAPAWSRDGKHLYYIGNYARPGDWLKHPTHLYRIPAAGGHETDLTPGIDQWLFNMVVSDTANSDACFIHPYVERGEERLAVVQNERGGCRLYSVPATGGRLRPEMAHEVNVLGAAVRRETGEAAVVAAEIMTTGNVFALTLDGRGRRRQLTRLNQRLIGQLNLTEPEEVVFRNGRLRIQGWVLKPPGFRAGRKYPTILEVHGGPMAQYGYTLFHEMQLLAAQGYVVVFTNPRGSSGFGTKFMNCIEADWGNLDYKDLMAVMDSVVRRPYVDGRRLGVTGGSYGGFMATWIVGHTNRFRAAVTQRQAGNFLQFYGASDFGYQDHYTFKAYPWEKPMKYLRMSPNFYAQHIRTPLLIIHSEDDLRCPMGQAEELFAFLKVQGKTVELVRFEGESHGLSRGGRPQNRLERLNRIVDWFRQYL